MNRVNLEEAKRLYESGMSLANVAKQLGVTERAVWAKLNAAGVPMRKQGRRTQYDHAALIAAYQGGDSLNAIAAKLGISTTAIYHALKLAGIERRPRGHDPGPTNPRYKGGSSLNGHGYLRLNGIPGRAPLEHRVIAERVLGRPLKRNEVVHHINEDKTDNRNCNLLICTNSYHRSLHERMKKAAASR